MATPSWWAIPTLTGTLALTGVFLGQFVLMRNERWRGRREDLRRWHQERLKLYNDILDEYQNLRHRAFEHAQNVATEKDLGIEDTGELDRLTRRCTLISTGTVSDAASRLWAAIFVCIGDLNVALSNWFAEADASDRKALIDAVDAHLTYEIQVVKEIHDSYTDATSDALVHFVACVREELGVPGLSGPIPKQVQRSAIKKRLRRSSVGVGD